MASDLFCWRPRHAKDVTAIVNKLLAKVNAPRLRITTWNIGQCDLVAPLVAKRIREQKYTDLTLASDSQLEVAMYNAWATDPELLNATVQQYGDSYRNKDSYNAAKGQLNTTSPTLFDAATAIYLANLSVERKLVIRDGICLNNYRYHTRKLLRDFDRIYWTDISTKSSLLTQRGIYLPQHEDLISRYVTEQVNLHVGFCASELHAIRLEKLLAQKGSADSRRTAFILLDIPDTVWHTIATSVRNKNTQVLRDMRQERAALFTEHDLTDRLNFGGKLIITNISLD